MKKILVLFSILSLISLPTLAQDYPVFSNYYFNPFVYNPAAIALNEPVEANVFYRKQWIDIPDAPQVIGFNFQYANRKNFSLGFRFYTEKSVALNTHSGDVTLGYRIPFSEAHMLQFGLSFGAMQNQLDFQQLSISGGNALLEDPLLVNAIDNSINFTSHFGLYYKLRNLSLGVSFPQLIQNELISQEELNTPAFGTLNKFIVSASYDINTQSEFGFTPIVLYRNVNEDQFQAEAVGLFRYKDIIWLGGGYRYESGPIGHLRFSLLNGIEFGYGYELSSINNSGIGGGSHEIHLKIKMRRKPKPLLAKEELRNDLYTEELTDNILEETKPAVEATDENEFVENTLPEEEKMEEIRSDEPVIEEPQSEVEVIEEPEPIVESPEPIVEDTELKSESIESMSPGYYVIVGAFSDLANAERYQDNINAKTSYQSSIAFNKSKLLYYVYVAKSESRTYSTIVREELIKSPLFDFEHAWILHIHSTVV
jgi:type IX secretion system PorP/SprF family membrane protein